MFEAHSEKSDQTKASTRWSQDRRLEFVDFRLRWDGRINRGDLTAFFGISVPQASLDIAKYLNLAPHNVTYDRSSKVYLATELFTPVYASNQPDRYLNELLARTTGVLQPELSFLGWAPPIATTPSPSRSMPVDTLVTLLSSIRQGKSVSVLYQSMSLEQPTERIIAPHAFAHDGFRWHVRAHCYTRDAFLDFVIPRMLSIKPSEVPGTDGAGDKEWHRQVRVVLMPNPELPPVHKRVIELDYGMTAGEVVLECRQALLFYALKRLGLLEELNGRPQSQQIVIRNRDDIAPYLPRAIGPR